MNIPAISIDAALKARVPQARLGCLFYETVVLAEIPAIWDTMKTLYPALQEAIPWADIPNLGESRAAYKACGKDPGRYRISSEALYRRIRQGNPLYHVNSVVDCNNLISIESGFSLGSYNLDMAGSSIQFRIGQSGEAYKGIGKGMVNLEKMPLLADGQGPFGCPTSDSERAMIGLDVTHVLTVIYSFSERTQLEAALALAERRLNEFSICTRCMTGIVE